jgi:hypothetical protein
MSKNNKGLNIMLSEQEKFLWDLLLAKEQVKLGKQLTTRELLLIILNKYQNAD